ncbi:MAG: peptidoglycan DD-metalloendopeptidase family protein [Clostridia bacterium]|nr:peptidoglycan DD-metalloendopeptidase family protein [Clostridia bacterium]
MSTKVKRVVSLFLVLFFVFSEIVYATDLTSKKQEINNKISNVESNISDVKSKQNNLVSQMNELSKSMAEVDAEIDKINGQLDEVNEKMRQAENELEEIIERKNKHYQLLKLRMRDMYENSTVSYLDMFLQSNSIVELIDSIYNISLIMKKDNEVLESIQELENEAQKKKDEIEEQKVEIELLKAKQENKKFALQTNMDEFEKMKAQLNSTQKNLMNQLEALEQESREVEAMLSGRPITTTYDGGQFTWPVPGWTRISSEFGWREGFRLQDGSWNPAQNHSGLDIPATKGTSVVAAAAGTVITSGWVNGYGYTIMIDHGSGLVTLYGHNSALVATKNSKVSKGQTISKVGSTGNSSGNHCHFEVRLNGKAVNPHNYLGK